MAIAVDCTSSPSVAALRGAGVSAVLRYLCWINTVTRGKVITKAEYDRLVQGGIAVVLNWEYDAQDWLSGGSAGAAHAAEAVRQAKALGYPTGRAIYGSCDFDMTQGQWSSAGRAYAAAFSAGVRAGGYRPGVYGPADVLSWCRDAGMMTYFWQAGMSTAWSSGRNRSAWPGAHLRQYRQQAIGGISVDINEIMQANYGQGGGSGVDTETARAVTAVTMGATDAGMLPTGGPDWVAAALPWTNRRIVTGTDTPAPGEDATRYNLKAITARLDELTSKVDNLSIPTPAPVALTDQDRAAILDALKAAIPTLEQIANAVLDRESARLSQ